MHLRALRDQRTASEQSEDVMPTNWRDGKKFVEDLESDHFKLTQRARRMLGDNPYADVERMCRHVKKLEELAFKYHQNRGNLGRRLEDEAIYAFELDIALFDSDLKPNMVESFAKKYEARPHVKVDDAKALSECGRIYFAMDDHEFIFIVDHIGLHNY